MAIVMVGLIYATFLAIGWLAARRRQDRSAVDFVLAGRALPLWLATLTMTATWVDGGYLLGTAEGVFGLSVATGLQGGACFGISLILGGVFFARTMRAHGFTTLIDPFEARFGPQWAVVLSLPAMLAEMFWSAELLVALGATLGVVLEIDLTTAILMSAAVVTVYTMIGGMWAVAYTDAFQLVLVAVGLAVALPVALDAVGGLSAAWNTYQTARPDAAVFLPPVPSVAEGSIDAAGALWTRASIVSWWDVSLMLMLGGIPWNCYFQRVLSCRSPHDAVRHSIYAGLLTILLTGPPLLLGLVAFAYPWPAELAARLAAQPADALPMIFKYVVPPAIGLLGLAAIIGGVTSSFSSSILSAGSMFSWNTCTRLLRPDLAFGRMKLVMRVTIGLMGIGAVWMALEVQSVRALWFFTSDLVFVLLFPQLVCALFDPKANTMGSMAAFGVSLILRVGGGEPLFGIPALIAYPEWVPFKTLAAGAGMILLPVVSRMTPGWVAPRRLRNVASET